MIAGARLRPLLLAALASASAAALATIGGRAAQARSAAVVPYPTPDVWPAAIRFLRVDQSYTVKEKDEPAGYVLFELTENKRAYRASLELVKTSDAEGRSATQLVCSMSDLPRRYEAALLDKLISKIRDERGPPPPPPARKPPAANEPPPAAPPREDQKPPGDPSGLPRAPTWGPPDK